MNARARVVITGLGAVSPLGLTWTETWASLLQGRSGIGPIQAFDSGPFKTHIAGEVRGFVPTKYVDEKSAERLDRFTVFALASTQEALAQAKIEKSSVDPTRVAVVVGSGIGGIGECEKQQTRLLEKGPRFLHPLTILRLITNTASGQIALQHGFQGPSFCTTSACASGAHALLVGLDLIRSGRADVVVAGGAESCVTPLTIGEFGAMQALSQRNDDPPGASRPFDQSRDGFVLSEGCGLAVLERAGHAERRGAKPLAEFRGAGMSSDAYHLAAPHPESRGYIQAMAAALQDSGLEPEEVGYLNAHATSTRLCDELEAKAAHEVFGSHSRNVLMSSTKSMTGHLLGAAGGLEFAVIVQSLLDQACPPTINLKNPAPECNGLDLVPGEARKGPIKAALSNSFGFGGHNVTLAVSKA